MKIGTRDETVARMSSQELTAWQALFIVKEEEREHQRDLADSGDGIVHRFGDEEDEDDGDGPTE